MDPTIISLSLPEHQLALLEAVKFQNERLIAMANTAVYLTEQEASERLKISLTTIRLWRKEGWLRYFAEGANIRYRVDYLDYDFEKRALVKSSLQPLITGLQRKI